MLMYFKIFQTIQKENQTKYGLIKAENFVNLFKKQSKDNFMKIYSTYNEGKPVVADRFIRALKTEIYKRMAVV